MERYLSTSVTKQQKLYQQQAEKRQGVIIPNNIQQKYLFKQILQLTKMAFSGRSPSISENDPSIPSSSATFLTLTENTADYCYGNVMSKSLVEVLDQPDYVHVGNLAKHLSENLKIVEMDNANNANDESDDDSVIFINTYYKESEEKPVGRRNPVRKTRSKRMHLKKEHILEEDFDFLDQIEEAKPIACRKEAPKAKRSSVKATSNELYKTWPINSCERPFYNSETRQIEPVQVPQYVKVPKVAKPKAKQKFFVRQRRPKRSKKNVVENFPVDSLKDLVSETLGLVEDFVQTVGDENPEFSLLLRNQKSLDALVNAKVISFS